MTERVILITYDMILIYARFGPLHTYTQAREHTKLELETLNLIPTSTGRRDMLAHFVQRALLQGDFV